MRNTPSITLALLFTTLALLSACSSNSPLSGSGNVIQKEKAFTDFSSVDISSGFEVNITQSDLYRITIIADDNVFDNLEVIHQDDTLKIYIAPAYSYVIATKKAIITMPDIHRLRMSAGSEGKISRFQSSSEFQLELSTASQLTGNLNVSNADIKLSEGSIITLDGSANNVSLDASTGSTANLENFITNTKIF